ncbi:MAG: hypothetical protein JXA71_15945, partial [Chitinispirillaceae bacterium]|nr:hypothetical protein [Chitinispirillaceae bacterium]
MNPFDFVIADSGGSLMPILIFIIWIIFSIIGGSNAKKKKRQLAEKRRQMEEENRRSQAESTYASYEEPTTPESTAAKEQEASAGRPIVDLEQELETIFGQAEPADVYDTTAEKPEEDIQETGYDRQPGFTTSSPSPVVPVPMPETFAGALDTAPS